jgi:GcrA cell cycle regulator
LDRFKWTEERVDRLKTQWADGCSAGAIAADLRGITRNAVIGKVHRLGLNGLNNHPMRSAKGIALKLKAKKNTMHRANYQTERRIALNFLFGIANGHRLPRATEMCDLVPETPMRGMTLLELDSTHCHWPCGEPGKPGFLFCGSDARLGFSYCAFHERVAHRFVARTRNRG